MNETLAGWVGGYCFYQVSFVAPEDMSRLRRLEEACGVVLSEMPLNLAELVA
jgi:hypothetical protein